MLRSVKCWTLAVAMVVIVAASAWAADNAVATGKWSWKQMRRQQGDQVEITLELKQDGDKLTGALGTGDMKTEIKEGTIKEGEISFVVVRERNGRESKTQYKGKIDGDTIKGSIITNRNGQERSREWVATRAK